MSDLNDLANRIETEAPSRKQRSREHRIEHGPSCAIHTAKADCTCGAGQGLAASLRAIAGDKS